MCQALQTGGVVDKHWMVCWSVVLLLDGQFLLDIKENRERNKVSKIRIGELFKKGTLTLDAFKAIIDMLYLSLVKLYYFICYKKQAVLSYWKAEHWKIGKIKFLILPFFIGEENLFSCKRSWKEKLKQFNQTEKCPPPPLLRHPLPPKLRQKMTKVSLW